MSNATSADPRALAARQRRAERAATLRANPDAAPHGSPSTYSNWDCRCTPCSTAHSRRMHDHYRGWAT